MSCTCFIIVLFIDQKQLDHTFCCFYLVFSVYYRSSLCAASRGLHVCIIYSLGGVREGVELLITTANKAWSSVMEICSMSVP